MRDIKRIKRILKQLEYIWSKNPDQRFGQLLINYNLCNDSFSTWNFEDNELEKFLDMQITKLKEDG